MKVVWTKHENFYEISDKIYWTGNKNSKKLFKQKIKHFELKVVLN